MGLNKQGVLSALELSPERISSLSNHSKNGTLSPVSILVLLLVALAGRGDSEKTLVIPAPSGGQHRRTGDAAGSA